MRAEWGGLLYYSKNENHRVDWGHELGTNTMHKLAESTTQAVQIPLLHIVDVTAAVIKQSRQKRVGLLATKFTMEEAFYTERMRNQFGIKVIVPSAASREVVTM